METVWLVDSHAGHGEEPSVDGVWSSKNEALNYIDRRRADGDLRFYEIAEWKVGGRRLSVEPSYPPGYDG